MERYAELKPNTSARDQLTALRAEFDRELAVLREPGVAQKLRKAFSASPAQIAEAANAASSRKR